MLDQILEQTSGKTVDGEKAFELYDTFGFPIDLTALILGERGFKLDAKGFQKAMQAQKDRSRAASEVAKDDWVIVGEGAGSEFLGYDQLEAEVAIRKYRKVATKKGEQFQLVLDRTPFYPEGGGQVGDKGYLEAANGDVTYVLDTTKENNEILHICKSLPLNPERSLRAVVDAKQRQRTARNHTATHLLHQALRRVLGNHVEQKGSAVHSKYLRFDFSHFSKLSDEELQEVEAFVNARISEKLPLKEQRGIPMEKAIEQGAIALFGEKYGEQVRTIRFGESMELCGGTHVSNTGDIWHFKIVSEGAIAAGVRRIEAITSDAVKAYFSETGQKLDTIRELLKNPSDPVQAVRGLQAENADLKKELDALKRAKAGMLKSELRDALETIDGVRYLAREVDLDAASMKDLAFQLGGEVDDLFLLLASREGGKALLTCYISKELAESKKLHAGNIVRELGKHIRGGGGGQPFFATAGGKDPEGIPQALQAAKDFLTI
jgi:alanyl-tRNA synthetase